MNSKISPKYQINLIQQINESLFEEFKSNEDVEAYLLKWHECYDDWGNEQNFYFFYKDEERKKIDTKKTLNSVDGETLLKIAIDLGISTPDYIPSIPTFKNELKSTSDTASQTFEKAFKNVESDPSLAIGLANSALESVIKEILQDKRFKDKCNEKETLTKLVEHICRVFKIQTDNPCPNEIKTLASSLMKAGRAIEDLRSSKTVFHGKTDSDFNITDSTVAYFIINATASVGLFLLNFYHSNYPKEIENHATNDIDLPF
ncbi:MAG: abortive infection family protein [Prevotella sp.]|nr:abortive infection family protein [Prevotella sp.]